MKLYQALIAAALGGTIAAPAFANHDVGEFFQRNINQQARIEKGLRSGELTTDEAAGLQRDQGRIARMQADAIDDGVLTEAERERIRRMQDRAGEDIYYEKHNRETGDSNSASAQRMLASVERNLRQQARIQRGIDSGQLTAREVADLLHGQARLNWRQARVARDGWVGADEQGRVDYAQNRQSERIWERKHDESTRW
jgi:hypothetical protein